MILKWIWFIVLILLSAYTESFGITLTLSIRFDKQSYMWISPVIFTLHSLLGCTTLRSKVMNLHSSTVFRFTPIYSGPRHRIWTGFFVLHIYTALQNKATDMNPCKEIFTYSNSIAFRTIKGIHTYIYVYFRLHTIKFFILNLIYPILIVFLWKWN